MFFENIPATITRLKSLSQLNLAANNTSGPLPTHLLNLTGMRRAYTPTKFGKLGEAKFGYGVITGGFNNQPSTPQHVNLSVITKGQERYYKDDEFYMMVSIDLSSNLLSGEIPEEIASLDGVVSLNLSWNKLSGRIPDKIGAMHAFESLDLKENKLYGDIPQSLSDLTYLSYLDLSYNNLTGRIIPSGGQLDTLYAQYPSMYDGNNGLCGLPLHNKCPEDYETKQGDWKKDEPDSKALSFSFALGVGYVVSLWVVFCAILFKKAWMITFFHIFDKAYNKSYVFVVVSWARWAQETTRY